MNSRTIPRPDWNEELDSFSRQHEGWIVSVAVTDAAGRARTEVCDLPLQGVSLESPGARCVSVMVGQRPDDHVTHEVSDAVDISIDHTEAGAERALRIRASDGSTTYVEFRTPMRPDEVDGLPNL